MLSKGSLVECKMERLLMPENAVVFWLPALLKASWIWKSRKGERRYRIISSQVRSPDSFSRPQYLADSSGL